MPEHILFLTGKLAETRLGDVLESLEQREFSYEVRNIGVSVAALMTAGMLERRLENVANADRVIVPGLCRGDLSILEKKFGTPFHRGCEDLKDLPVFFGRERKPINLDKYAVRIFAEIVEAAEISVPEIINKAQYYKSQGADVIDLGCLPDTAFPHLEDAVDALQGEGFSVSVDSMNSDELLRGGKAGADYLLSLKESTLWIAEEVDSVPVLIPDPHPDMESLYRSMEALNKINRSFIADSILDPIHFGFTTSIGRYAELRGRYPDCEIMMGIGNLTELTEADTSGINALLFGIISELNIDSVLATEVSPHARTAIAEANLARRINHYAKQQSSLPKGIDEGLLIGHERKPFPYSIKEITELASQIRDPSYRIQVTDSNVHIYNRDSMLSSKDAFDLFPQLDEIKDDPAHAFYLGYELSKAEIALELGKRYIQDERLNWGVANSERRNESVDVIKEEGTTLKARKTRIKTAK